MPALTKKILIVIYTFFTGIMLSSCQQSFILVKKTDYSAIQVSVMNAQKKVKVQCGQENIGFFTVQHQAVRIRNLSINNKKDQKYANSGNTVKVSDVKLQEKKLIPLIRVNSHLTEKPTAAISKGGKKIDPFGIAAIVLEAAAIYTFFGLHLPVLSAILVIGGIIVSVRSIKRCNDMDKYGGKSIPVIASIFGGIALFLLLVMALVFGVIVPLA